MLSKIHNVQQNLEFYQLDGWLLYDFRRNNDLACQFLDMSPHQLLTRRFAYWIPAVGEPIQLVHAVEENVLTHLPGKKQLYCTWQEWETGLQNLLTGKHKIGMEYSPRGANPYLSKVDAGTLELIRSFGIEVVSSENLLQSYMSVWIEEQLHSHRYAASVLEKSVEQAWKFISKHLKEQIPITEYMVQQKILQEFAAHNCETEGDSICAVNAHSADPHYTPSVTQASQIQPGDWILIDLWCKQKVPNAVYADITRVGIAGKSATPKQKEIFTIVQQAQQAALDFVKTCFLEKKNVTGAEIDHVCREVIKKAGYGIYFTHRTGHNIGIKDHGNGAHIDGYETLDTRVILPGTCFSIEPGIYLPNEFGVRLEYDVYIHLDGAVEVTGGIQTDITFI